MAFTKDKKRGWMVVLDWRSRERCDAMHKILLLVCCLFYLMYSTLFFLFFRSPLLLYVYIDSACYPSNVLWMLSSSYPILVLHTRWKDQNQLNNLKCIKSHTQTRISGYHIMISELRPSLEDETPKTKQKKRIRKEKKERHSYPRMCIHPSAGYFPDISK